MADYLHVIAAIALLWFAATLTPGPDFLLASRVSMTLPREAALRVVLGIACGTVLWGLAGFFGIHVLFEAAPWLYLALKVGGGAYLILLGVKLLIGDRAPAGRAPRRRAPVASAFALGLLTNLANPKAPLFATSLFAATLPAHPPMMLGLVAAATMGAISLGWFGLVVRLLTAAPAAAAYSRLRRWIDRVAGAAFIGFGTKLALER
jgi:threonine/homoserine/homoserine lactone efflux protein